MLLKGGNNMGGLLHETLNDIATNCKITNPHSFDVGAVPFNMTIYDLDSRLQPLNFEIVQVTNITPGMDYDTFTIIRSQESTTAIEHAISKNCSNFITWEVINSVHGAVGSQTYTEQNYVTDDESLTDSVDGLDINLKDTDDKIGDLSSLNTTDKTSAVNAINEVDGELVSHMADSTSKHITESGSNANGSYIKFDDGTLICHKAYSGSIGGSDLVDSMYQSVAISWTFPHAFNNVTDIAVIGSSNAVNGYVGNLSGLSINGVGFRVISTRTFTGRDGRLTAIGRWK